jgi:hypothetical protein
MARTKPTLICSHPAGDMIYEVCEADAVYAVLYQGKPVKVRTHNPNCRYQGYKYAKSMFPESGHAINLAQKLNAIHHTEDFTVAVMAGTRTIPLR